MELSSKLKAMKFMKRKDDAEERKKNEQEQQKSVERTHWTLEDKSSTSPASSDKPKFIIEYDNTSSTTGIGRTSFGNFNKEGKSTVEQSSTSGNGPLNKIPKLSQKK